MDAARWKTIKEAYLQARDEPIEVRFVNLSHLDPGVRTEVEKLLRADASAGEFIERPYLLEHSIVDSFDADDAASEGTCIDDYVISARIGSGGMGTVFLADHVGDGYSQKVALKLIKRGMDTDVVLRRFLLERQILSSLEHPYIARMLDGGSTHDGLPYFVMEYVDGAPIREYCSTGSLDVRSRVELFAKVCSAVSYAHQKLVVHRDLKPSNILVTKSGEPKLLDFGIAKILGPDRYEGDEAVTATQFRILTPEYSSPEQLRGEPTTTLTDVFSLGVVLYELLTGSRPFSSSGKDAARIVSEIQTKEPRKPSIAALFSEPAAGGPYATDPGESDTTGGIKAPATRSLCVPDPNSLKGDIDNIVLKAIRHEPDRRYSSVQEFLDDIERYLQGLPVHATADTISYRAGKFIKRHRSACAASAAMALLLIAASGIAGWQAVKANNERAAAEARFNDLRVLANSLIFDIHDSIRDLPGSTQARKNLVARAIEYLDKLSKEGPSDMSLQLELAAGYERIADVQGNPLGPNLGEVEGAIESYGKALNIRRSLADPRSSADRYSEAMLNSKMFRIMQVRGDLASAESHCKDAVSILEALTAEYPEDPLYRVTAARFLQELGDLIATRSDGDSDEVISSYRKSVSMAESIPRELISDAVGPDGLSLREKILSVTQMSYRRLGQRFEMLGRDDEALLNFSKALEESEKLWAAGNPRKPAAEIVLAISLGNAGRLKAKKGNLIAGKNDVERAIEICRRESESDEKNYLARSELALANWNAGNMDLLRGDLDAARMRLNKAMRIQSDLQKANVNDLYNLSNLADTYASLGSLEEKVDSGRPSGTSRTEAAKWYRSSLEIWDMMAERGMLPGYYSARPAQLREAIARLNK